MGQNRKVGRGNKDFKKGPRGGCLKKVGTGTPLQAMSQTQLEKIEDQKGNPKEVTTESIKKVRWFGG